MEYEHLWELGEQNHYFITDLLSQELKPLNPSFVQDAL